MKSQSKVRISLQDTVLKTILGGRNSVQGPFLLKSLFVGLKTMSPSIHYKYNNTARSQEAYWLSLYHMLVSLNNRVIL